MHLTLKQETTRPPARNHLQQQERFDEFSRDFNEQRPHEALEMKTPSSLYRPSQRKYTASSDPLEYPTHDTTRKVMTGGSIRLWQRKLGFIGRAFEGERVGLRQLSPEFWLVSFAKMDIGFINSKDGKFTIENPLNPPEEQ